MNPHTGNPLVRERFLIGDPPRCELVKNKHSTDFMGKLILPSLEQRITLATMSLPASIEHGRREQALSPAECLEWVGMQPLLILAVRRCRGLPLCDSFLSDFNNSPRIALLLPTCLAESWGELRLPLAKLDAVPALIPSSHSVWDHTRHISTVYQSLRGNSYKVKF